MPRLGLLYRCFKRYSIYQARLGMSPNSLPLYFEVGGGASIDACLGTNVSSLVMTKPVMVGDFLNEI